MVSRADWTCNYVAEVYPDDEPAVPVALMHELIDGRLQDKKRGHARASARLRKHRQDAVANELDHDPAGPFDGVRDERKVVVEGVSECRVGDAGTLGGKPVQREKHDEIRALRADCGHMCLRSLIWRRPKCPTETGGVAGPFVLQ